MRPKNGRRLTNLAARCISATLIATLLCAACSSGMPFHAPKKAIGTSTSTSVGPSTAAGPVTSLEPPTSTAPAISAPISPPAWCTSGNVAAQAGSVYSIYGNGEAVDVTITQHGPGACLLPSVVSIVLTGSNDATLGSANSSPGSAPPLTLTAGQQAKLRIDWVSQGCFSPAPAAASAIVEWATPQGSGSLAIQGFGQDSVAPCHSAFGVSDLQPVS